MIAKTKIPKEGREKYSKLRISFACGINLKSNLFELQCLRNVSITFYTILLNFYDLFIEHVYVPDITEIHTMFQTN